MDDPARPPDVIDPGWWERHRDHFEWSEKRRVWIFKPLPEGLEGSSAPPQENRASPDLQEGRRLGDFLGQDRARRNLEIAIRAARLRNSLPPHILLSGPPGLGKTSLARAVARELGARFTPASGPALGDLGALVGILSGLGNGPGEYRALFIDEIHRLPAPIAEFLYGALDGRSLPLTLVFGARARVVELRLEPFLLIGATTEEWLLPRPLHGRFGIREKLDYYSDEELAGMALRAGPPVKVSPEAARALARGSRGTPRWLLSHLSRAADLAQLESGEACGARMAERHALEALRLQGIDASGLTELDRKLLRTLLSAGKPIGERSLADLLGENRRTLAEIHEPYLLRRGLIRRTHRGRVATERACRLLAAS